jgi:hypothetical protein
VHSKTYILTDLFMLKKFTHSCSSWSFHKTMCDTTSLYNFHSVGLRHLTEPFPECTGTLPSSRSRLLSYKTLLTISMPWSLLRCCLHSQSKVCPFLSRYTDSMERDSAVSVSVSRSSASGLNSKSYRYLCITSIPQSILKVMEQRQSGTATFRWQKTLSGSRLHSIIHPKFAVLQKYRLITKSLCTWWLQYQKRKHILNSTITYRDNVVRIRDNRWR